MNKNDLGPIEEDILIEDIAEDEQESQTSKKGLKVPKLDPVKLLLSIPNYLLTSPKRKFTTLMLILGIIIVIYAGLLLLSTKPPAQTQQDQKILESPKTQTEEEKTLSELNQKIQEYSTRLDNLDNYRKKLSQPIVNLEIRFEQ